METIYLQSILFFERITTSFIDIFSNKYLVYDNIEIYSTNLLLTDRKLTIATDTNIEKFELDYDYIEGMRINTGLYPEDINNDSENESEYDYVEGFKMLTNIRPSKDFITKIKHLCVSDEFLTIDLLLSKNLESLELRSHVDSVDRMINILRQCKKLKNLYRVSIYTIGKYNLSNYFSKSLKYLSIERYKHQLDLNYFKNLVCLEINIENRVLDLSDHNLRHLGCICNNSKIIFNNNLLYENVKLIVAGNKPFTHLNTKCLYYETKEHINTNLFLDDCTCLKLILTCYVKVITFPKYLTEIQLSSMLRYTFSDFPDSIEYITVYAYYLDKNKAYFLKI